MSMDVRKVKLDFNQNYQSDIPSVQGDTGRSIEFQIMDGSVAKNITGETIKIFGLKPDGFRVFNNAVITDAEAGKCTVDLTEQMLCVAGTLQCTLVRYKNGLRLSSKKFNITVSETVADDIEIESTNEYVGLTNLIGDITKLQNEVEEIKTSGATEEQINTAVQTYIDEAIASGEMSNLVIPDGGIESVKIADDTIGVDKINKNAFSNIFSVEYLTDMVTDKGLDTTNNYYSNGTKTVVTEGINIVGSNVTNLTFYDIGRNSFSYKPSATDKVLIAFNYKLTSCSLSGSLNATLMLRNSSNGTVANTVESSIDLSKGEGTIIFEINSFISYLDSYGFLLQIKNSIAFDINITFTGLHYYPISSTKKLYSKLSSMTDTEILDLVKSEQYLLLSEKGLTEYLKIKDVTDCVINDDAPSNDKTYSSIKIEDKLGDIKVKDNTIMVSHLNTESFSSIFDIEDLPDVNSYTYDNDLGIFAKNCTIDKTDYSEGVRIYTTASQTEIVFYDVNRNKLAINAATGSYVVTILEFTVNSTSLGTINVMNRMWDGENLFGADKTQSNISISAGNTYKLYFLSDKITRDVTNAGFYVAFMNSASIDLDITIKKIDTKVIKSDSSLYLELETNGITEQIKGYLDNSKSVKIAGAGEAQIADNAKNIISTWKGKKIATFGDSLSAQNRWQPYVISKLGFGTFVNCGIGGTAISTRVGSDGNAYNEDSFYQDARIAKIPADADLITIMGGFNDFNKFTVLGTDALPSTNTATVRGAMCQVIEKILTKLETAGNQDCRIVIMTQPYGYTAANPSITTESGETLYLKDIHEAVKEVANFYHIPVIDLWNNSGINYKNRDYFLADTVHPNAEKGAKRMAEIIILFLRSIEPLE